MNSGKYIRHYWGPAKSVTILCELSIVVSLIKIIVTFQKNVSTRKLEGRNNSDIPFIGSNIATRMVINKCHEVRKNKADPSFSLDI